MASHCVGYSSACCLLNICHAVVATDCESDTLPTSGDRGWSERRRCCPDRDQKQQSVERFGHGSMAGLVLEEWIRRKDYNSYRVQVDPYSHVWRIEAGVGGKQLSGS